MDLNVVSAWASIISLFLSAYALVQVYSTRQVLRVRTMDAVVRAKFAQLERLRTNATLTTRVRIDVSNLLKDLDDFYLARFFLIDREPKIIVERIRNNLQLQSDAAQLKRDLELLESLLFTSTRI